jgi:hypothetical protein
MSSLRYYLPDSINNKVMYLYGLTQCYLQPYINNTFTASYITDKICIGDLASATNDTAMLEQGITHIISVVNGVNPLFPKKFTYLNIHVNDDPWINIDNYFDETNKFIDTALELPNSKVMIHCQKGVSRSVTILLAYFVYKYNNKNKILEEEIDDVISVLIEEIKEHRKIAEPNVGFIKCLKKYIKKINNYKNI